MVGCVDSSLLLIIGNLVRFAPARFRVPVSEFRNSGESETRVAKHCGQAQLASGP